MIKFVYFDFGAVLVNYDEVFEKVCNDFNLNREDFRNIFKSLGVENNPENCLVVGDNLKREI